VSPDHHGTHDKHEAHSRLVGRLRALASDVERLTRGLDEEALATRTVPDKWSLKELVVHLWRVQQVFEGRIDAVLTEDTPAIRGYTPDGDERFDAMRTRAGAELIAGFLAGRERFTDRLDRLSAAEWRSARAPAGVSPLRRPFSGRVHGESRGTPPLSALPAPVPAREDSTLSRHAWCVLPRRIPRNGISSATHTTRAGHPAQGRQTPP
jgi:hypothetical protein